MQWSDDAVILSVRPHGETSAIVEALARGHGRALGLVRGGRSRRSRPALQPGNLVRAEWRARLAEHLGSFDLELITGYAARAMEDAGALAAITTMGFFARLLPERDPHPALFDAMLGVLERLDDRPERATAYACFEMRLLQEFGFGLDLSECAATGAAEGLIYVSPKSGRAVSAAAGEPYKSKLFALPPCLLADAPPGTAEEAAACLAISGHFLARHVLDPLGERLPDGRALACA